MENQNITGGQMMMVISELELQKMRESIERFNTVMDKIDIDNAFGEKEYLGKKEACKKFSLCPSFFEKLRLKGEFPTYKIGTKVVVKPNEMRDYIKSCKQ